MAGAINFTWTRKILCIGVKWSSASACRPTWSSVERVRVSQMFFAGHHKAWSDQSFGFAGRRRKEMKTLIISFETIFHDDDFLWPNFPRFAEEMPTKSSNNNNNKNLFSGMFTSSAELRETGKCRTHISSPPKADIRKHFRLIWPWISICSITWRSLPNEKLILHGIFAHHVDISLGAGHRTLKTCDKNRRNEDVFVGENILEGNRSEKFRIFLFSSKLKLFKPSYFEVRNIKIWRFDDDEMFRGLRTFHLWKFSRNENSWNSLYRLPEALLTLKIAVNYVEAFRRLIGVKIFITSPSAAGNFRWLGKLA